MNLYQCDICKKKFELEDSEKPYKLLFEYNNESKTFDLCEDCAYSIEILLGNPQFLKKKAKKAEEAILEE
ncbi:MAG: hypothetical protein RMI79_06245 [Nitrososphaerota archaeon]|nr:hypothetical protein [Nitrososphaerota archaeon]